MIYVTLILLISGGILHVFPNQERFPEQFKAWLALVPENQRPPHNDFHNQRVCDRHFILRDRNRNNRLNALAVPTLHLPGNLSLFKRHADRQQSDLIRVPFSH